MRALLPLLMAGWVAAPAFCAEKGRKTVKPAQPKSVASQPEATSNRARTSPPSHDVASKESAPPDAIRREAQKLYETALAAYRQGDLAGAKKSYMRVLEISPGNTAALVNLALVEQRLGNNDEAERRLRDVLRADQQNASAWLLLGMGAYYQGNLDAAHAHLAQATLYAPKNAQAHQFLGVVLGRKGWYSAGEEELRKAVELDPNVSDSHYNLAVLYLERVPPAVELARRHYHRALELGAKADPEVARKLEQ